MTKAEFQERLQAQDQELTGRIEQLLRQGEADSETNAVGELSSYDNHPADLGTETFEREKDLGLLGNLRLFQGRVREALERLDQGTFGTCQHCGQPIAAERLEAIPWTPLCLECQEAAEAAHPNRPRPLEETSPLLSHPVDLQSWWQVADWGTSSDPGDLPAADVDTERGHLL